MDLKELLGEELFNQVSEKAGDKKIAIVSDGNWFPKQKFDEVNNESKLIKEQLTERDEQLEALGNKAEGSEELKAEIESLKTQNQADKDERQRELDKTKLFYEIDQSLIINKARDPKVVRPLLDEATVKFDESGNLIGLSEQLENLKASHDYLFEAVEIEAVPPVNTFLPGSEIKTNPRKDVDPALAGKQKAMERFAPKKAENEEEK